MGRGKQQKKAHEYLRKDLVNFLAAFYPIKDNFTRQDDFAPDTVLPHPDPVIILISLHFMDVKFFKNIFCGGNLLKHKPFDAGPVPFLVVLPDLLRKVSCTSRQASLSFFQ
jgi:hypothetical protein